MIATLYTGKYEPISTINSNAINITLTNSARISGLVLRVSSNEPIEIYNIKNIPSPGCYKANTTVRDKGLSFGGSRRRYTTLFHCPTKDVELSAHPSVSWIFITFSDKIRNCEPESCPSELEFIELYEAVYDMCKRPDVPPFGKLVLIKNTNNIARYKYQCEDYFVMPYWKSSEVVCTQSEDWSPKKLPKCEPNVTCSIEELDDLRVSYNWLWTDSQAVVGTIATFECIDNSTKINGSSKRECRHNGEWSEELPQCIQMRTTTEPTTLSPPYRYTTEASYPHHPREQSQNIQYPTYPNQFPPPTERYPNPYPTANINPYPQQNPYQTPYPTAYPTAYPTPYQTPYQTPHPYTQYPPVIQTPYQPVIDRATTHIPVPQFPKQSEQSINISNIVYIILGILLGILITIGVIYYINKRRRNSLNTQSSERRRDRNDRTRDEVYYDHMNHNLNNFNESPISNTCLADETVDTTQTYPYDSCGYVQIEESLRMDTFKKYENYDTNSRKQHKPLPEVPK